MTGTREQYTVIATPWKHGWELGVQGVGATQSHTLEDADMMARDLIARRLSVPADSFDVKVTPRLGDDDLGEDAARDLRKFEKPSVSHALVQLVVAIVDVLAGVTGMHRAGRR